MIVRAEQLLIEASDRGRSVTMTLMWWSAEPWATIITQWLGKQRAAAA
jgi:hypothetical protein